MIEMAAMKNQLKPTCNRRLIVFGRYPVPGKTKTRLIPALGPAGAALLQRRLTEHTIDVARRAAIGGCARRVFCYTGGSALQVRRWFGNQVDAVLPQTNGSLGHRMHMAFSRAFAGGARQVVLVGTDIPDLTSAAIEDAFEALADNDLVLGPSTDGGYWLIGMNQPQNLFEEITWSRPDVLQRTLALARKKGLKARLLPPLDDVDTPTDLARSKLPWKPRRPYLSVVIPTIDEAGQIERALSSATDPDAEIIVCDGGSRDRTKTISRSWGARVIQGSRGRAAQQNRGAAEAGGAVLLFLHADTRLPAGYVTHIFETLMNPTTVLGAFRFDTDRSTPGMRWVRFWTNLRAGALGLPYGDQGLFMWREAFFHAGGFPDVPIAEDLYLVRQMNRHGTVALVRASIVTSARRWQRLGIVRTTLINTIIAAGCLVGVAPGRLAPLYRLP